MHSVYGDLWTFDPDEKSDCVIWRGITTNQIINKKNKLVMGSGCAWEARERFPGIDSDWAAIVAQTNREMGVYFDYDRKLFMFPTKIDWRKPSPIELIEQSARELANCVYDLDEIFILPRPGVGAGSLSWDVVEPLIDAILPDNVYVITWSTGK